MTRLGIALLLITSLLGQSALAVADVHHLHQSGTQHREFNHEHTEGNAPDSLIVKKAPFLPAVDAPATDIKNTLNDDQYDCHHCCHCHHSVHFYLTGTLTLPGVVPVHQLVQGAPRHLVTLIYPPHLRPPIA